MRHVTLPLPWQRPLPPAGVASGSGVFAAPGVARLLSSKHHPAMILASEFYCWRNFSAFFIFLSAFFSFGVLAGSFLADFFAS